MVAEEAKDINKKKKKNDTNDFRRLAEESIKAGGLWEAEPGKEDRDDKRDDDTGTAKSQENHWNSKWSK